MEDPKSPATRSRHRSSRQLGGRSAPGRPGKTDGPRGDPAAGSDVDDESLENDLTLTNAAGGQLATGASASAAGGQNSSWDHNDGGGPSGGNAGGGDGSGGGDRRGLNLEMYSELDLEDAGLGEFVHVAEVAEQQGEEPAVVVVPRGADFESATKQ